MHSWLLWALDSEVAQGELDQASGPKYHHQRKTEKESFSKNTSKEKLGHSLPLHQLFHQNFYPAVSGSPYCSVSATSKPEHTFPKCSHTIHVHYTWAQPANIFYLITYYKLYNQEPPTRFKKRCYRYTENYF